MMQDDLNRLILRPPPGKRLNPTADPAAIRSKTGLAEMSKTGGIASPLTETAFIDRVYYDEVVMASSDGIFTIRYKPINSIKFNDGLGDEVMLVFKEPE